MSDTANVFGGAYNSFSGVDIKAVLGSTQIGTLQAVSYSITREKAPVYVMGSVDPKSFSRGKRGIAGTLIFVMYDRHALLTVFGIANDETANVQKFYADIDEIKPQFIDNGSLAAASDLVTANNQNLDSSIGQATDNVDASTTTGNHLAATPWYADQILPFDITLGAASEYGHTAVMRIYGCEILNEGYGISVDDMQSSQQSTYVARAVVPWVPLGNKLFATTNS